MIDAIMWFRQDLRVADNPALNAALQQGRVLPIYIHDTAAAGEHVVSGASALWLHHALASLEHTLQGHLQFFKGDALQVLNCLCARHNVRHVHWNRCYEPWRIDQDTQIKATLIDSGVTVQSHNGSLLWEPWQVAKPDGKPYRVFTPFYRKGCKSAAPPRSPLSYPYFKAEHQFAAKMDNANTLQSLELTLGKEWETATAKNWKISEIGASEQLDTFLASGLVDYKTGRNIPASANVSRLSPYLHHGLISPHTVWHAVGQQAASVDTEHFLSELGWREFSYYLLFHFPRMTNQNFQANFQGFTWEQDSESLAAWQRGKTGIPIVDAGMRELWQTGYMHNRVRMVVASFLTKNLRQDWRDGAKWFWQTLFDADLANNTASWQWVAGCGADAAPYFRIFNPVTQGGKFDSAGVYTRSLLPELAALPDKYLFAPWLAPAQILKKAGIVLGETYPNPIVDLKASREAALQAYAVLKANMGLNASD